MAAALVTLMHHDFFDKFVEHTRRKRFKGSVLLRHSEKAVDVAGLSFINRESIDAIRTAVWELEKSGYITRRQGRDEKGKMTAIESTNYEQPQPPGLDCPVLENPTADNPILENPTTDNPTLENPMQLNKDISRTNLPKKEKSNTDLSITHALVHNPVDTKVKVTVNLIPGNKIAVSVRDNGKGMDEKELSGLWSRYYRGTNTKERPESSGLGLAIAKQIIALHGGDISVVSNPGLGTEFTILLPCGASTN